MSLAIAIIVAFVAAPIAYGYGKMGKSGVALIVALVGGAYLLSYLMREVPAVGYPVAVIGSIALIVWVIHINLHKDRIYDDIVEKANKDAEIFAEKARRFNEERDKKMRERYEKYLNGMKK